MMLTFNTTIHTETDKLLTSCCLQLTAVYLNFGILERVNRFLDLLYLTWLQCTKPWNFLDPGWSSWTLFTVYWTNSYYLNDLRHSVNDVQCRSDFVLPRTDTSRKEPIVSSIVYNQSSTSFLRSVAAVMLASWLTNSELWWSNCSSVTASIG